MRIQHLDECSNSLADMLHPNLSPVRKAITRWTDMMRWHFPQTALSSLMKHLMHGEDSGQTKRHVVFKVRAMCAGLVAQTHWRLAVPLQVWPYPLGKLADPRFTQAEKLQVAQSLFDAPACCVDPYFGPGGQTM